VRKSGKGNLLPIEPEWSDHAHCGQQRLLQEVYLKPDLRIIILTDACNEAANPQTAVQPWHSDAAVKLQPALKAQFSCPSTALCADILPRACLTEALGEHTAWLGKQQ
jgi:hypothetical protein